MPQMNPMNWLFIFIILLFSIMFIWTNFWFKKNLNPSSKKTTFISTKFNPLW